MRGIEVKKRLQNNGLSLKSVADLMGETPQNLNSMLNAQDIKTGVLERIAEAIKKPLYFFYTEKEAIGLMSDAEIAEQEKDKTVNVGVEPPPAVANHPSYQRLLEKVQEQATEIIRLKGEHEGIPLIPFDAAAGFGSENFSVAESDIQDKYRVPDFNGIDFMVRVKGNSMYPKYSSGDVIACRKLRESKFIEWNKPHLIATTEHGLIVKRIREHEVGILAVSDNKDYAPFVIPHDEITGLAVIVGVIRLE